MSGNINRVVISGNLTRDCEMRATQSGTDVLRFSIACNDRRKNAATGEWEDVPNFLDCTMFGNRAQALSHYLSKGTKVAVDGRLRWHQWEDKTSGRNRSKVEIIVDDLELMSRDDGQGATHQQPAQQSSTAATPPAATPAAQVYDEDLPF